jgi:hypothetical protein
MLNEFENGKRYIFDLESALIDKHLKVNYDNGHDKYWVDYCNGRLVNSFNKDTGRIGSPTQDYYILPKWCKEV